MKKSIWALTAAQILASVGVTTDEVLALSLRADEVVIVTRDGRKLRYEPEAIAEITLPDPVDSATRSESDSQEPLQEPVDPQPVQPDDASAPDTPPGDTTEAPPADLPEGNRRRGRKAAS